MNLRWGLVLFFICGVLASNDNWNDHHNGDDEHTFDYIVVGAGAGGATLAKELSDDKHTSVLLLEAGPNRDSDPNVQTPSQVFVVRDEAFYNFDYFTSKVKALGQRRILCPVGRMWGGSSSHNLMFYVRGNHYDFDNWAANYGGPQWNSARVYEVYKQMENNSLANINSTQLSSFLQYHGTHGRVNTHNVLTNPAAYEVYSSSVHAVLGISENPDYNGAIQEGIARPVQMTQQLQSGGTLLRESASSAFLGSDVVTPTPDGDAVGVHGRKLRVSSLSYATKLIFNQHKKVVGIKYIKEGEEKIARVNKEVIISAGALHTPAILMHNGIGNCTELAGLGIDCVFDNPSVGKHLQDHPTLPLYLNKSGDPSAYLGSTHLGYYKSQYAAQYTNLSVSNGLPVVDSVVQLSSQILWLSETNVAKELDRTDPATGEVRPYLGFTLYSLLLRPKCEGYIQLASRDPLAPPVVHGDYLCDPLDFDWAYTQYDNLLQIAQEMISRDPTFSISYPTPELLTPEHRNNTIRSLISSIFHHSGTARMGEVVDGNLCVKGVEGLRVADASIMPHVTTGNTNAPSMMIGKQAADIIKRGHVCRR